MIPQLMALLLLANSCLNHEVQELPLPKTYDGFTIYGKQVLSINSLTLEAFYDFYCPDCKASYPLVMQAIKTLNLSLVQNFTFVAHYFPLPYHRYSFIAAQVEKYIKDKLGDSGVQQYMELLYQTQQNFWNNQEYNTTEQTVKTQLAKMIASNFTQLNEAEIMTAFQNASLADRAADSWKYGCSRGVTGTPTYFVNGVEVTNGYAFTQEQWIQFLSQYYPTSQQE